MVPQWYYDKFKSSPVGIFLNRLVEEEHKRGGDTRIPGSHGSIIDQVYHLSYTQTPDKNKTKFDGDN